MTSSPLGPGGPRMLYKTFSRQTGAARVNTGSWSFIIWRMPPRESPSKRGRGASNSRHVSYGPFALLNVCQEIKTCS